MNNEYLNRLITGETLVDIFFDRQNETEYCFILNHSEEYLLLERYQDEGHYNGVAVVRKDDACRIRWGGNDISNTAKIIRRNKFGAVEKIEIDTTFSAIKSISEYFGYVTVHPLDIDDGICMIGEVESLTEESIVIREYGTKGNFDRKHIMMPVDDICRIEADGVYERNLRSIYK